MKNYIIFFGIVFLVICSFDAFGAGIVCGDYICSAPTETSISCPKDCALATISWPTGILGHCPTVGGYVSCCYVAGTNGVCGLKIGGICMPDAAIFTQSSYMFLVKYSTDAYANQGRCAIKGPKMNNPKPCYFNMPDSVIDASNHTIECIDPAVTDGTTLNSTYCTSQIEAKKTLTYADLDGKKLSVMQPAPMTLKCKSFNQPSKIEYSNVVLNTCKCPLTGCAQECKPSYQAVATPVTVVAATCADTYLNNLETDVDCGGNNCRITKPCANGKKCVIGTDCLSKVCTGGICLAPSCTDGAVNQDETDIDCGGTICNKCADGKICIQSSDCISLNCDSDLSGALKCQAATCLDTKKNQDETDVDCGGLICEECGEGKICLINSDCATNYCDGGLCKAVSCSDGFKNGEETDIDCGDGCEGCADGKVCSINKDCESKSCVGGLCAAATCSDGILNQDETSKDCGGAVCDACQDCALAVKAWTDLITLDKTTVAKGIPIYVLIVGANCEGVTADFEVKQAAGDLSVLNQPAVPFNLDSESGAHFSILEVDTSALGGDYYYTANIHRVSGDELLNSKAEPNGILTVSGQCFVDEPGVCASSALPEVDVTRVPNAEGKYQDVDCDGIADCIDNYLYGTEGDTLSYINGNVGGCTGSWDCSNSEWSECTEVNGELVSTRVIRDCAVYANNCCIPPEGQICTPPPSRKVCIDEEEFPVFSFMNVLLVSMMLTGLYFCKRNF